MGASFLVVHGWSEQYEARRICPIGRDVKAIVPIGFAQLFVPHLNKCHLQIENSQLTSHSSPWPGSEMSYSTTLSSDGLGELSGSSKAEA